MINQNSNNVSTNNSDISSDVNNNGNNDNTNNTEEEKTKDYSSKINEMYDKIGEEYWASKKESDSLNINNGVIEYSDNYVKNQKFDFEYGKVKYVEEIVRGGVVGCWAVITEDGNAYEIDFSNPGINISEMIQDGFKINKIELGEKVIDITQGNASVVPLSGPYYLTESGKLLTANGKSYDAINRNHIIRIGGLDVSLYINEDRTLEIPRLTTYIDVVDNNNKKVKAKYVFVESSTRWTGTTSNHYYIVDENMNLLHCSSESLFVTDKYSEGKVTNITYDKSSRKVNISLDNGTNEVIEDVFDYRKL